MKNENYNPILDTDSYKFSHPWQYKPGTTEMFSYVEARGSIYDRIKKTQFFGLQGYIREYLQHPITQSDIEEAKYITELQGVPFHEEGWEHILKEWKGYAPIEIKAIPEGTNVSVGLPLITVKSLDPKVFWAVGHYEAQILRAAWYGTSVATISKAAKNQILSALEISSDDPKGQICFKLQDFGARGVSSYESSQIGGAAHLTNFMGTDTIASIKWAINNYSSGVCGYSIPAAEHSTITIWGLDNEVEAYRNMIKQFGQEGKLFAVVSDSRDIYNAVNEIWGKTLRQEVIESKATLVVRPDSGKPVDIVMYCLRSLEKSYGFTVNSKGFKVLNNVRVIQGDGVNLDSIQEILDAMIASRFSIDNIAFGMGGALLQKVDRDTFKFAMKCSGAIIDGKEVDVYKDPITDKGKVSKKGYISTFYDEKLGYYCDRIKYQLPEKEALKLVYSGRAPTTMPNYSFFEDIRKRADSLV